MSPLRLRDQAEGRNPKMQKPGSGPVYKLVHYRVSASSDSLCGSRAFRQTFIALSMNPAIPTSSQSKTENFVDRSRPRLCLCFNLLCASEPALSLSNGRPRLATCCLFRGSQSRDAHVAQPPPAVALLKLTPLSDATNKRRIYTLAIISECCNKNLEPSA